MKKIFSLFLSLALIVGALGSVDLSAYAKGSTNEYFIVNPLLKNYLNESELIEQTNEIIENKAQGSSYTLTADKKEATSYNSVTDAAKTLRDHMVKREKTIAVTFLSGKASLNEAWKEVFYKAIDQSISTSSEDGDYLKWNWESAGVTSTKEYISKQKKYLYNAVFTILYNTTYSQEQRVTNIIKADNKALNLAGNTDYQKILAIHNYVCEKINYDYFHLGNYEFKPQYTAYGGLATGYSVCQGYALVFYRMCLENNLPCRIVTSYNHAWNIVKLSGTYYYVDCTWDDTCYDDSDINNYKHWSGEYYYKYFLCGSKDLEANDKGYMHSLESDYLTADFKSKYPISQTSYECPHELTAWQAPSGARCEDGFESRLVCKVCNEDMGITDYVPENSEHQLVSKTINPSCEIKGYTITTCSLCSEYSESELVNEKGHTYKYSTVKSTTSKDGKIIESCSYCGYQFPEKTIGKISTIALSATSYAYNGNAKTPTVTIKDCFGKKLVKGTDYTVTYPSARKNVGKYAVKITFKGKYSGTATKYYYIKPKSTTISGVTASKRSFTVKWKKQKTQTTGYQIQYATNSRFVSGTTKSVLIKKNTNYAKKITKLSGGKKYYVRIRTYKTVKINGKSTNIYSSWSAAKAVTTKR